MVLYGERWIERGIPESRLYSEHCAFARNQLGAVGVAEVDFLQSWQWQFRLLDVPNLRSDAVCTPGVCILIILYTILGKHVALSQSFCHALSFICASIASIAMDEDVCALA